MSRDGWDYAEKVGITVLWMETVAEMGIPAVIKAVRNTVGEVREAWPRRTQST